MTIKTVLSGVLLAALVLLGAGPASAAMSQKDLEVLGRALSFMVNGPSGDVPAAVVFEPGNATSEAERDAILGLLGSGLKVGPITLKPKAVAAADAPASGAKVWLVTTGAGSAVGPAGAAAKVVTASTDKACVEAGHCVLGIETAPKVQIYVSRKAADAAGVSFESAFLIMVKEL
ncbi:MAG: hypothetical protein RLY86_3 [Pseudomonadota bacterium]|jgi:hypothetical protein